MNVQFSKFQQLITNSIKYKIFMLTKLPMGFFSGLKIVELNEEKAAVSVRFKWLNQNPFQFVFQILQGQVLNI